MEITNDQECIEAVEDVGITIEEIAESISNGEYEAALSGLKNEIAALTNAQTYLEGKVKDGDDNTD